MGTDTAPRTRWTLMRRRHAPTTDAGTSRRRQAGQVLPIFAVMSVVLLGGAALITDVAWWWTSEQQMQRAADAAALAGAVYLPGDQPRAFAAAQAEAIKNGYTNGTGGVTITPRRDPGNPRKLLVDIDGSVGTNFARVFCWQGGPCLNSIAVGVTGAAEFVLPVPMGSPQNYYGVGLLRDVVEHTSTSTEDRDTGFLPASAAVSGTWSSAGSAYANDNAYATTAAINAVHQWRDFALNVPTDPSVVIQGLQVRLTDVFLSGSATSCRVGVEVSWDNGTTWSTRVDTPNLGTTSSTDHALGSATSTSAWGSHAWVPANFDNTQFRVRLTRVGTSTNCPTTRTLRLDLLEVRVDYAIDVTTTTTTVEEVPVMAPDDVTALAPQNFWGSLQSQGAPNIQGDAYMTYYDTRTSATNTAYNDDAYYQYGIDFPAGSSNGEVWIFDPGFCNVDTDKGTGEYYTMGGSNGSSSYNPVSTFYDLWNTHNTPYDYADDFASGTVGTSGTDYKHLSLRDTQLSGSVTGTTACDDLAWHHDWVRIGSGLSGNNTYRLHTYSTDPSNGSDQQNTTALNNFAIWATASGGTPRVYGLGAMEAYVRLPGGRATEFYLARIDDEHAGKTMAITLWDPGDTGSLSASLQILAPGSSSYSPVPFTYTAVRGSGSASSCQSRTNLNDSDASDTTVVTNTGGTSLFNGCWLNIEIHLDDLYDAPHPSSDTLTSEGGWWKIRYTMGGATSSYSTDLTTWQVQLRGNPVHLVPE